MLAMTESAAPSLPPSILGFDFDGAGRAGGAQQEARDVVAETDNGLLDRLARAGMARLQGRLRERATRSRGRRRRDIALLR